MSIETSWTGSLLLPTSALWGVPAQKHSSVAPLSPRAKLNSYKSKSKIRAGFDAMSVSVSFSLYRLSLLSLTAPSKPGASGSAPFPRSALITTNTTTFKDWAGPDSLNTLFTTSVEHLFFGLPLIVHSRAFSPATAFQDRSKWLKHLWQLRWLVTRPH